MRHILRMRHIPRTLHATPRHADPSMVGNMPQGVQRLGSVPRSSTAVPAVPHGDLQASRRQAWLW